MKKLRVLFILIMVLLLPIEVRAALPDHLILINIETNQLSYFENGNYIRTFPVSTGKKETPTPEGKFLIANKYKNKKYHRKKIEGGAWNNPLGTRWMGLNYKEYGIHGTNKEHSVGTYESNGCIRMNDRNIQWLYDRVPLHTRVIIKRFYISPEMMAHTMGYRVTSWSGKQVQSHQIGRIRLIDRTMLYWRDLNGTYYPIKQVMPNETYAVFSHDGAGTYHIGSGFYIIDKVQEDSVYEQIPNHILVNQYKRKQGVL
ncbi:L,D-transpeptidase [Ectobacillus sp. JY-23]|uniref:L,D-transpeptidase n=1 Tax=Ectobacillus sp. JY-23 TaxID=2933872 RepID=UPI001FF62F33|nr:L,D-transpeptidase [Ectobacillus sp. JY-23]UOY94577.1 L,D-transpeptidase [Ectobacillus sp. JY-23]